MTKLTRLALTTLSLFSLLAANAAATDKTKEVDNTVQNKRDRNQEEVTPMDQSNRSEDLTTTKRIRQAIVANKSLSTDAHNVKVITANGRVTLRGPVKTEEEKRIIGALAVEIATAENVENKLDVKNNN